MEVAGTNGLPDDDWRVEHAQVREVGERRCRGEVEKRHLAFLRCGVDVRADDGSQHPSVTWSGADVMSARMRALRSGSSLGPNSASERNARCAGRQSGLRNSALTATRLLASCAGSATGE